MKKENLLKDIKENITDKDIKNLFHLSSQNISLTEENKSKLYNIPLNIKKQSFLQKFLEREIVVSLPSLAICASLAIMVFGIYLGNFILIRDVPKPKYEIINIQTTDFNLYVSQ